MPCSSCLWRVKISLLPHSSSRLPQIPETSPECRWNWRHGRCEPFCQCHFKAQWGDFHLGRACRKRDKEDNEEDTDTSPLYCDVPPETPYAILVKTTLERTNSIKSKTRTTLLEWKNRVQEETCGDLPTECSEDAEDNRRSLKEELLCRHVPSPCNENDEEEELPLFVSPLDKVNASKMAAKDSVKSAADERRDTSGEIEGKTEQTGSANENVESSTDEENATALLQDAAWHGCFLFVGNNIGCGCLGIVISEYQKGNMAAECR